MRFERNRNVVFARDRQPPFACSCTELRTGLDRERVDRQVRQPKARPAVSASPIACAGVWPGRPKIRSAFTRGISSMARLYRAQRELGVVQATEEAKARVVETCTPIDSRVTPTSRSARALSRSSDEGLHSTVTSSRSSCGRTPRGSRRAHARAAPAPTTTACRPQRRSTPALLSERRRAAAQARPGPRLHTPGAAPRGA